MHDLEATFLNIFNIPFTVHTVRSRTKDTWKLERGTEINVKCRAQQIRKILGPAYTDEQVQR